jgi:hypothetical protein
MASAAEAEIGALYIKAKPLKSSAPLSSKWAIPNHQRPYKPTIQPPTASSTLLSTVNYSINQQRSRAIDMRFYWVRDRVRQNNFLVYWKPGRENLGDYFTKHHPPAHHQTMRSTYLQVAQAALCSVIHKPTSERGCVDSSQPHTTQAHNPAHNPLHNLERLTHLLKHRLSSLT